MDSGEGGGEDVALECGGCGAAGLAVQGTAERFFWCRDCGRTLCGSCNGRGGHSSTHRSAPWQDWDVLKSAALGFDARSARRTRLAERELKAISDFVKEIGNRLSGRVQRDLERRNEADRRRVKALLQAMGDDQGSSTLLSPPAGGPPSLDRTLTDADLTRMAREAAKVQPGLAAQLFAEDVAQSPIVEPRGATFSTLPSNLSPRAFLVILEEQLKKESRRLEFEQPHKAIAMEDADSSFGQDAHDSRGHLNVSTSTPLEEEESHQGFRASFRFPLEPRVNVSNGFLRSPSPAPSPRPQPTSSVSFSGPLRTSEDGLTTKSVAFAARKDPPGFFADEEGGGSGRESPHLLSRSLPLRPEAVRAAESPAPSPHLPPLRLGSAGSTSRTPTPSLDSAVDSFHFGEDFLSRPIDVAVLPGDRLAVSDSYGGVYVTTRGGVPLHKVTREGESASSLAYSRSDQRLYVSFLLQGSNARAVRAYDANSFTLQDDFKAPTKPDIDIARTRWLATGVTTGDVFLASGDGKRSAIWKLSPLGNSWITVREYKQPSRYQYLQVVEENAEKAYHVVMTVDGVSGAILLLVVDANGRVWNEYDLGRIHRISEYIRAPASAVVDSAGNVLVVDYQDGRLWFLAKNKDGPDRLKVLTELGPKQALGISVSQGWAYVACLGKRRVQAVHYREGPSSSSAPSPSLVAAQRGFAPLARHIDSSRSSLTRDESSA